MIRELANLATNNVIALIEQDKLKPLPYRIDVGSHGNTIFEHFFQRRKWDHKTLKLVCEMFKVNRIDLMGIKVEQKHMWLCFQQNLVSLRLGNIDWSTDEEELGVCPILYAMLNYTTCQQLRRLDLSGSKPLNPNWLDFVADNLPQLTNLGIAGRIQTNEMLEQLTLKLPNLCVLDISHTKVTDISSVANLPNLQVLTCHNLNLLVANIDMFSTLTKLRVLDISRVWKMLNDSPHAAHIELVMGIYRKSLEAMTNGTSTPWPDFQAIDMSGIKFAQDKDQALKVVKAIVAAHPHLKHISILGTPLDYEVVEISKRKEIHFINRSLIQSEFVAMYYYTNSNHPAFLSRILKSINSQLVGRYLNLSPKSLIKHIRDICRTMQSEPGNFSIQKIGIAVFDVLCDCKRMETVPQTELDLIIDCLLDVLKYHKLPSGNTFKPGKQKEKVRNLRKDLLKVFNSKNMPALKGNRLFQICQTVLDTMLVNENGEVGRLIVSIASHGLPNLPNNEVELLTQAEEYVKRLVQLVLRLETKCADFEEGSSTGKRGSYVDGIKKALNVLSLLVSDCPMADDAFLKAGGIAIGLRILKTFQDIYIQSRTLELLDNLVGKVNDGVLLKEFCEPDNITFLMSLMDCDFEKVFREQQYRDVGRSYFACTLLVSLLTYIPEHWTNESQQTAVCEKLVEQISQYPDLKRSFIAYDFLVDSFCDVISTSQSNGAIIWSLWTVLHLLRQEKHETPEYCHMKAFVESELYPMVTEMADGRSQYIAKLDSRVVHVAKRIVKFVVTNTKKD